MASSRSREVLVETHLYEHVYLRTLKQHGRYESVIENDKKGKSKVVFHYKTEDDAKELHEFALMWTRDEYREWRTRMHTNKNS